MILKGLNNTNQKITYISTLIIWFEFLFEVFVMSTLGRLEIP